MTSNKRLLPTGDCWCGCPDPTSIGAFFRPGHDRIAQAAVTKVEFGGVPGFLVSQGYGPGGKKPIKELEDWSKKR